MFYSIIFSNFHIVSKKPYSQCKLRKLLDFEAIMVGYLYNRMAP